MTRSADIPENAGDRRRRNLLLAALLALAVVPDVQGQEAIVVAQEEAPEEPGLFNWLGNLLGRGLSSDPRPTAAPGAQPAESDEKPAKDAGMAPADPAPPTQAQPSPAATTPTAPDTATVGLSLEVGKAPPVNATPSSCITKARETVRFCVEPVEWPESLRAQVWVHSHMYQGTYGIVRYDEGRASYIHALIPTASYDSVVAWYVGRWGAPDHTHTRQAVSFNEPKAENPTAIWQRPAVDGKPGPALETRRFDDTRGGFADSRNGVVMLYAPTAKPIFPQLSSVELMALRIVEDAPEPSLGAARAPAPSSLAAAPPQRPSARAPAGVPPQPPASPPPAAVAVPRELPAPPAAEANPFIPLNPVAPKLAVGSVEAPASPPASPGAQPTPPAADPDRSAAAEEKSEGVFSRLARLFDTSSPTTEAPEQVAPQPPAASRPRVDRTPDLRPPVYGFFTRLIRTYTDDGAEIARIGDTPPVQGQMLRDVPLAIDERLRLGMVRPGEGQPTACLPKDTPAANFCLMAPTWPPGPAPALVRSAALPAIGLAALRFDSGRVSHIQLPFNGEGFDQVVGFFAERYGPPTERSLQRTTAGGENPVVLWRSINSNSGAVSTLEIRRYDDVSSDRIDSRIGLVRVYQSNTAPQFPPLTSYDLSALP